jgi:RNA polymerase sigma factor (sigma-70 family)
MNEALDGLLGGLTAGDPVAAEQIYRAIEPYLLNIVRARLPQMLRAKFDSTDILQSVWADALCGIRDERLQFDTADHLRSFLMVAARNRMIDRIRRYGNIAAREQAGSGAERLLILPSAQPRPSEEAQASEMWEQLLVSCQSEHRPILELRRQGYSLAEIGARTGFHPDSIRRILRSLARKQACAEPTPKAEGELTCLV